MSVRSLRPWDAILARPARPTPWYLWPLALLLALGGGFLVADPKTGIVLFGLIGVLLGLGAILARPQNGFLIALCIFPEYTVFRGLCSLYNVPLPLSLVGMWTEVVLLVMMVSLMITGIRSGQRLRFTWFDVPVLLLFLSGIYGLILSLLQQDMTATLYGFHGSITPFCFYFLARWLHHKPEDLPRLLRYWLIGFALLAIASIYDFIFRPEFVIRIAIQVRDQFWGKFEPHSFFRWYPRMQSLMFAEQTWGTLCGLVVLFCMARLGQATVRDHRDRRWRQILWWILPLGMFGLIFSMSRGAHVSFLVACLVLFGIRGGHRRIIVIGAALGIVALGLAFMFFGSEERVNWLITRTASLADRKNDLAYERVNQWQRVLQVFPLFPAGRGLGKASGYAMYHGTGDGLGFVPDGGWFKILAEQGIPGLGMFVFGSAGLVSVLGVIIYRVNVRRPLPHNATAADDRALAVTVLPFFCGLLVQNIGGNIFESYFLPQLFWLLVGLVVGRYSEGLSLPVPPLLLPAPASNPNTAMVEYAEPKPALSPSRVQEQ